MVRPARFTFDLNLEPRGGPTLVASNMSAPPPVPTIPEDVVAQLVAEARQQGYADGLVAGEQNAADMAVQTIAAASGALAANTAELVAALDRAIADHHRESVELALSVGRKLALNLIARQPIAELDALVAECLTSLSGAPHLVIRCHPDLADAIRDATQAHMASSGFTGRLVVMGDPEIRLGDGRLEWIDGGVVRDIAAIAREIDQQITTYLAARSGDAQHQEHGR